MASSAGMTAELERADGPASISVRRQYAMDGVI
jgi:hypothetical protein